jgi:hypothetical protein
MRVVLVSTVEAEVLVFQFLLSVSISGVLLVDQSCFFLLCITSDVGSDRDLHFGIKKGLLVLL